jgi:hypothetical protein
LALLTPWGKHRPDIVTPPSGTTRGRVNPSLGGSEEIL